MRKKTVQKVKAQMKGQNVSDECLLGEERSVVRRKRHKSVKASLKMTAERGEIDA